MELLLLLPACLFYLSQLALHILMDIFHVIQLLFRSKKYVSADAEM